MNKPQVQILLSTFNGALFLRDQLDSIYAQSYTDWELLVRDDGSLDGTLEILEEYQKRNSNKMKMLNGGKGGNASESFMSMLPFTDAPYLMFCDQDDIWQKDKVKESIEGICEAEKKNPLALFFTDMKVVDEKVEELFPSFFEQQKLLPEWSKEPYYAFAQSIAAGCTMIFTRALKEKLHPIKAPLFQHDHWLLMHASFYGQVEFSHNQTVLYRQHQSNAVGSHDIDTTYFLSKFSSLLDLIKRWRYIKHCFGNEVSIIKIMRSKWRLNQQRI